MRQVFHTLPLALTVFRKDSIIISYLMLNIHSIKTVSSLVVYLTFDDFRYDCNDVMFKWRWIRLLIILTLLSLFSLLYYRSFFVCFYYSRHSVRMPYWNKRLLTCLQWCKKAQRLSLGFKHPPLTDCTHIIRRARLLSCWTYCMEQSSTPSPSYQWHWSFQAPPQNYFVEHTSLVLLALLDDP